MPPHPKHVATLSCELFVFKTRHAIEANCHVTLSHSKTVLKQLCGKISII